MGVRVAARILRDLVASERGATCEASIETPDHCLADGGLQLGRLATREPRHGRLDSSDRYHRPHDLRAHAAARQRGWTGAPGEFARIFQRIGRLSRDRRLTYRFTVPYRQLS